MCLGIPGRLVERAAPEGPGPDLSLGVVDFGGVTRQVSLAFVPEARVGDYLLVHVGFAISRIDPEEAERVLRAIEELGELEELEGPGEVGGPERER